MTLSAPSKAGDLLVLNAGLRTGISQPITAVSDGKNKWTKIRATAASGQDSDGEMWYSANAASVTTVTVHNGSAASVAFEVQEFSGVATSSPLATSAGTSNTGTAANSGSATSTAANELAVGFVAGHGNSQAITVTSSGYATQPQQVTTDTNIATVITGVRVMATPGAQSLSGTFGTAMYGASGIAIFKGEWNSGGTKGTDTGAAVGAPSCRPSHDDRSVVDHHHSLISRRLPLGYGDCETPPSDQARRA